MEGDALSSPSVPRGDDKASPSKRPTFRNKFSPAPFLFDARWQSGYGLGMVPALNQWSFAASLPVVLFIAAAWLLAVWLGWANWHRSGRPRWMAWLEMLRLLIVTLIAFTLLRPEIVFQTRRTKVPEVVVLFDASASMKTRDVMVDPATIVPREEWLQQQRATQFWKPLEKQARATAEDFAQPPPPPAPSAPPPDEGTDLNQALENALQRYSNLKAVLVLSDGDWNLGKSPVTAATRFRSREIPIFTLGIGSETPLPDLVLQQVSAPSYGLLGEQISIPFRIQSHLPRDIRTTVTLQGPSGVETQKAVTIPASAQVQDSIVWLPRATGEFILGLKVPVERDECLTENNEQSFRIAVRAETLKVLVVESLPRWEYRYLRNALARDPGVEMQCLLLHPGLAAGGGRNYIASFPDSREVLSKYDVVFLGDVGVGAGELQVKDAESLKGLVEQQASGLVFLPGARGRQLSLRSTPLADLLPVVYDASRSEGITSQTESHLTLTSLGKGHLLTMLAADEARNQEIWRNLPGFFWCAAVEKSRPGSEILAVHSSLRNSWGRAPLLVTRSAGNGKVLFMGTDSAWRWRRGVEDKYHYRFWSQVVRWMSHQRHLAQGQGIRLTFTPEDPRVGDMVFLQATVFDASGFPIEKGRVSARVESPSGKAEQLDFTPLEGGWGVFKASFSPQQGGRFRISVTCEKTQGHVETPLTVILPKRERPGQPANFAVLREIANITHGASGGIQDLSKLIDQIKLLPEPRPLERRVLLWCHPGWGAVIILLLTVYWTARKLAGTL